MEKTYSHTAYFGDGGRQFRRKPDDRFGEAGRFRSERSDAGV
jgi:hypothetical protein